jgi:hypothetical protein
MYLRLQIESFFFLFLALGLCLLPFSTDPNDGIVVVAYGLPFIFVAGSAGIVSFIYCSKITNKNKEHFTVISTYVFFILSTTLLSEYILKSFVRSSVHFLGFCLFLQLVVKFKSKKESYRYLMNISLFMIYSGVIMACYNIFISITAYLEFGPSIIFYGRATGAELSLPWASTNVIGACLLMPLTISIYLREMNVKRGVIGFFIVIIVISIITTTSRNSLICVFLLFTIIALRQRKYFIPITMASIVTLIVGTVYLLNPELIDLFLATKIENIDNVKELGNRTDLMTTVFNYYLENPLSPIGYYSSLDKFGHSSHNYFITVVVEQGIFALIISVLLIASLLKISNNNIILNTGILIIFLNLSLEDANFTHPYIIYFWIFICVCFLNANFTKKSTIYIK